MSEKLVPSGNNFDLLAASLRADQGDMASWVAALGTKLAGALPARVRLQHAGLFGNGRVSGLAAELGSWQFLLRMEHGQVVAARTQVVRGVALKTEPMTLEAWLDALTAELSQLAATSARDRAALLNMLS